MNELNQGHGHYHHPPPPPRRDPGRRGGIVWILTTAVLAPIISGLVFLAIIGIVIGALSGGEQRTDVGLDDSPDVKEVWSCGEGAVKVVRIPIKGVLVEESDPGLFGGPGPVATALRQIRAATMDQGISGIILEINSPGGGITACDRIYKELQKFRNSGKNRVIVAILGDVAASGGYYVAAAADRILAHPTTVTGSIGVLISALNVKGFGDKYGVRMETIKSGINKDMLNPFSDLTEEQRAILQGVVDEMYERFVQLVDIGRPGLREEEVRAIADGRIMSGPTAEKLGLVDVLGYWDDAMQETSDLLGVSQVKVVRYEEPTSLSSLLRIAERSVPIRLTVPDILDLARVRVMYLADL